MFKKFIAAALAAISFSTFAGNSTIIKLDDAQPIRYEAEHIVLNVVGYYANSKENNNKGDSIIQYPNHDKEVLIAFVDPDSPPVKALLDFTEKWDDPKPGNCYIVGSKKGGLVLSSDDPWETKFDSFSWVQCPYTSDKEINSISGVVTDIGEVNGKYYLALNNTKPSWYDKKDYGVNKHLEEKGAIRKGECVVIYADTDQAPYIPGGYAKTNFIQNEDCDSVSRHPVPATPRTPTIAKTFKRVDLTQEQDGWVIIKFDDDTRLVLRPDDPGLKMFKSENSRRPTHMDCIGYTEHRPKGHNPKTHGNVTSMMRPANGSECNEGE